MMDHLLRLTLVQTDIVWEDTDRNIQRFSKIVDDLTGKTDLVVLPEMFSTGFSMNSENLAEEMQGRTVAWMQEVSAKSDMAIMGSIIIKDKDLFFNRLLFVSPDNRTGFYDKRHLFRMGEEDKYFHHGNVRKIFSLGDWRICPQICYDLRFPVWSRNRNDYDLLVYVANWPESRREVWKALLKARAIENQSYVVGVNRVGIDGRNLDYAGDSMLISPKGEEISNIPSHEEAVETYTISLDELKAFRQKFPVHLDADDFKINGLP